MLLLTIIVLWYFNSPFKTFASITRIKLKSIKDALAVKRMKKQIKIHKKLHKISRKLADNNIHGFGSLAQVKIQLRRKINGQEQHQTTKD